jgi:multidrug transporter EmrE-like cation transporter
MDKFTLLFGGLATVFLGVVADCLGIGQLYPAWSAAGMVLIWMSQATKP